MKVLRWLLMLIVFVLVIGAVAAYTCPADLAYRLAADKLGPIRLGGLSGSVWEGHAATATIFNLPLGSLDWQLQAAPLLSRTVMAHLDLKGGMIAAAAHVTRTDDGQMIVRDGRFHLPAEMLAPAVDIPSLQLLGEIDISLNQATLKSGWVEGASGSAVWTQAGVSGAAEARFGDMQADFSSAPDGAIAGVVKDLGGPLAVSGTFQVHAGEFDTVVTLTARDGNPQIAEALRYVGQPQAGGSSLLRIHGNLFKLQ